MKIFKNRAVAWVVLVLAVVGSVCIGLSRKDSFLAKEPVALPGVEYQQWICDEADMLSDDTVAYITERNADWDAKYYAVVAVATADSIRGWTPEEAAKQLGADWKLGKNDMLLLMVRDDDYYVACGDSVLAVLNQYDTMQAKLKQSIEGLYYSGDFDGAAAAFFRQADVFYGQMAQMQPSGGYSNSYNSGGEWNAPAKTGSGGVSLGSVVLLIVAILVVWALLDRVRIQPLPAAVYSGRAGERGAARVTIPFSGDGTCGPVRPAVPGRPMAATVRRQAGRDLPPAADIARPRAAIVRHGAIPGPAAVLAAAAGAAGSAMAASAALAAVEAAAASVEAASAVDTGNTVAKKAQRYAAAPFCQFLRSLRNGNTLSLTVVRPTAIIRPPLIKYCFFGAAGIAYDAASCGRIQDRKYDLGGKHMLDIQHLTKRYGEKKAVDDLTLHIAAGEIYGFIGHNGAGKTTTLKSVVGILQFDQGEITIDGKSIKANPLGCKREMAYIPDNPDLYDFMTGIKYLNFVADIFGVGARQRQERIRKYADAFELTEDLAQPIAAYSHGMKQKLAIIAAWLHQPKLIIMDEPFVGLDPKASHLLKGMMREVCDEGGAIFFSTHVLEVAEKLCDKVAIIKGGKLIRSGTMEEVKGDDSLEEVFLELEGEEC